MTQSNERVGLEERYSWQISIFIRYSQRESCLFGCSRSHVALRFGPFDASLVAGSSELGRGEPGMCFPLRIHATSFIWRLFRPFAIRDGEIIDFNPGGKGHLVPFELDMVEQVSGGRFCVLSRR